MRALAIVLTSLVVLALSGCGSTGSKQASEPSEVTPTGSVVDGWLVYNNRITDDAALLVGDWSLTLKNITNHEMSTYVALRLYGESNTLIETAQCMAVGPDLGSLEFADPGTVVTIECKGAGGASTHEALPAYSRFSLSTLPGFPKTRKERAAMGG